VVWKLDRLGRDLRHLVNTVHELTKRGVGFKVLSGHGASIDTTTPAGKWIFGIFARKGGAPFKMTVAKVRLVMAAMGKPKTKSQIYAGSWG
jgi:DNA invertase Pin-like site-specific DNA recombinase